MKKNNNTEKAVLDAQNISESLKKGTESVFQSLINDTLNKLITVLRTFRLGDSR